MAVVGINHSAWKLLVSQLTPVAGIHQLTWNRDARNTNSLSECLKASHGEPFWMETIKHTGISPFLNDTSYSVYRNVKDFGAVGDGVTDDTAAIQKAIDGEPILVSCQRRRV